MLHDDSFFSFRFFDKAIEIKPEYCKGLTSRSLFLQQPFTSIKNDMELSALVFLHQVHGKAGQVIFQEQEIVDLNLFTKDGDFLVTNQPGIGLGIATADCLPLVFVDLKKKVIGAAHAGWRGSCAHIVDEVVLAFQNNFSCALEDIKVFFGPSAKNCCYEVDAPFIEQVGKDPLSEQAFFQNKDRVTFDLAVYNALQLYALGFKAEQLNLAYNLCTICNDSFCSVRREKGSIERQITVVSLK